MEHIAKKYFITQESEVIDYKSSGHYERYLEKIFEIPVSSSDLDLFKRNYYFEKLDKDSGLYQYSNDSELVNGKNIYVDYCKDYLIENGHSNLERFETYTKQIVYFVVLRSGKLVTNVVDNFGDFDFDAVEILKEKGVVKESEHELAKYFPQLKNRKSVLNLHSAEVDDDLADTIERDIHNFSIRQDVGVPILFQVSHHHKGLLHLHITRLNLAEKV